LRKDLKKTSKEIRFYHQKSIQANEQFYSSVQGWLADEIIFVMLY
jgi:hypothetical protein